MTAQRGLWFRLHLGKIWNLPNTAIGLIWGVLGLPFGARVSIESNAIQFTGHRLMIPNRAIALGNTVIYGTQASPSDVGIDDNLMRDHERQHTIQGEQLGPLYLLSNLVGGVAGLIVNRNWYGPANWNERGPQKHPPRPW